jgi:predicted acylesterase/phospholipase RssA
VVKRALALAGGGPAVGLSIGALEAFEKRGMSFDLWSCACIGAWLAVAYNHAPKGEGLAAAKKFFRGVFRPDDEYERFPIASVFAPDFHKMTKSAVDFVMNPLNYANLVVPEAIVRAAEDLAKFATDPSQWNLSNVNTKILNDVLAVNPASRFATSLIYLSAFNGLSRTYYKDSAMLESLHFEALYDPEKPVIIYNSYNVTAQKLELFTNKPELMAQGYGPVIGETLCACSALPYIEEPVTIGGDIYVEGATIETVNFEDMLKNFGETLEEIWVSRILDRKQVRPAKNLYEALNNLVMLFAATTSEDDVKIFEFHLEVYNQRERIAKGRKPIQLHKIHVCHHISYDWTYSNLERSIKEGRAAAELALANYPEPAPGPDTKPHYQASKIAWPAYAKVAAPPAKAKAKKLEPAE